MPTHLQEASIHHCQSGKDLETEHSAGLGSLQLRLQGGAGRGKGKPAPESNSSSTVPCEPRGQLTVDVECRSGLCLSSSCFDR